MEKMNSFGFFSEKTIIPAGIAIAVVLVFAFFLSQKAPLTGNLLFGENPAQENILFERDYGIPLSVFEDLPLPPSNFAKMVSSVKQLGLMDYSAFCENYFLQPEFYPSFKENGLVYWKNPDTKRIGVAGIGFFPAVQEITMQKPSTLTAQFFVHAAFGVQSFQGIGLKVIPPQNAKGLLVELLDSEFLLGPSFPKFSSNWAKRVLVKITADESVQGGEYVFTFETIAPSKENSEKWQNQFGQTYFETATAGAKVFQTFKITIK